MEKQITAKIEISFIKYNSENGIYTFFCIYHLSKDFFKNNF